MIKDECLSKLILFGEPALRTTLREYVDYFHGERNRVTEILNGRRAITGDTALRLAHFFVTSARFWLNLQSLYELRLAEQKAGMRSSACPLSSSSSRSTRPPDPRMTFAHDTSSAHCPARLTPKRRRRVQRPPQPARNAYVERFNGTFRTEVLDQHAFTDLEEGQRTADEWLMTYNEDRPHQSIGIPAPNAVSTALAGLSVSPLAWSHTWGKDSLQAHRELSYSGAPGCGIYGR